jgi:hypothetical protein
MRFRLLIPILVFAGISLGACGKGEDPAEQQAPSDTGAAQEEKTTSAATTETAKEEPAAPKAGQ